MTSDKKKKRTVKAITIAAIAIVVFAGVFLTVRSARTANNKHTPKKNTSAVKLDGIAFPAMNTSLTMSQNWFGFYNDRLYFYEYTENGEDVLYSTDLNLSDAKKIAVNEELRYATFLYRYGDELYYYTPLSRCTNKINLDDGAIKKVADGYYYIVPDTFEDGVVLINRMSNTDRVTGTVFAKLDLKTDSISDNATLKNVSPYGYFFFDGSIYFIDKNADETGNYKFDIYKNGEVVYSETSEGNLNYKDFVFVQDGYLFFVSGNTVKQIDLSEYKVVSENALDKTYELVPCTEYDERAHAIDEYDYTAPTSVYPFFCSEETGDVFIFDSETLSFKKILGDFHFGYVRKFDNYYVFQDDFTTKIYNSESGKNKSYNSIEYGVEDGCIYLFEYKGDLYDHSLTNKYSLKKIAFDEIFAAD